MTATARKYTVPVPVLGAVQGNVTLVLELELVWLTVVDELPEQESTRVPLGGLEKLPVRVLDELHDEDVHEAIMKPRNEDDVRFNSTAQAPQQGATPPCHRHFMLAHL